MDPFVSVIIVNYNSGDRLSQCLDSLEKQTFRDFEVIIIDNDSSDHSMSQAEAHPLNFTSIYAKENLGFAAGNNKAVQRANGKWLAFLNPDAYPARDWLGTFVEGTKKYPAVEAFGSTQIDANRPDRLDGAGDVYHILGLPYRGYFGWNINKKPEEGEVFAACGAAAFYTREIFENLGGFEERFFCYGEDVDLGFRLRLSGGRTIQLADAVVRHEGSGVSGRHSDFTLYHGHRNRIWLAYKNTPFWLYWPFFPLHLAVNFYLLLRAIPRGISRPYFSGIWDGYKGLRSFREDRKKTQKTRQVSYKSLSKAIEWSPLKISSREGKNW